MNSAITVVGCMALVVIAGAVVWTAVDHHKTTAAIRNHYAELHRLAIEADLARRVDGL